MVDTFQASLDKYHLNRIMQCFISHASEDKDSIVRDLAYELRRKGRKVWYDEFSLRPGDSLRRSIDQGLAQCNIGIVVLSHAFFSKEWPQRELDALLNAEIGGTKKIFAIWHGIDASSVGRYSPLLADKIAIDSRIGVEKIAESLKDFIPHDPELPGELLATTIELYMSKDSVAKLYAMESCRYRFLQLQSYFAACQRLMDEALDGLNDQDLEVQIDETIRRLEPKFEKLSHIHKIPTDIEILREEPLPENRIDAWLQGFDDWAEGTAGEDETLKLLSDIEIYFEVDYLWMLFGLPNFSVSDDQRRLLGDAISAIGSAAERNVVENLQSICDSLRSMDASKAV